MYAKSDDPWSFRTSEYEREKYDRTVATLQRHYARGLEIGCSIGVLTRRLAQHVEHLLAVDISARAVEQARLACHDLSNVTFAECDVITSYPAGPFDLIVASEVAYYWSGADFASMRERIAASLCPHGEVLLVHFLPKVPDYVWGGDAVHEAFLADSRFRRVRGSREQTYRIDLLTVV
ncbi:MAG: nodulation S family protein [Candidatus Eremiobacteraeota bacterium]|nr:nodulation S family protein [Candidatus Eremiobacteraeota bacterium]